MLYRFNVLSHITHTSELAYAYDNQIYIYLRLISKDTAFSAGKQFVVSLQPQSVTAAFNCS